MSLSKRAVSKAKYVQLYLVFQSETHLSSQMRAAKLCLYVNKHLLPSLDIEETISEITAIRWLKKLGFSVHHAQKGVYVDGHERKDVVEYRREFIGTVFNDILPYIFIIQSVPFMLSNH